jgi:hypothetical protein
MSKHQKDATDASGKDSSDDNMAKSSRAGLKVVKNEPLPTESRVLGK